jgi:hypothetical protein
MTRKHFQMIADVIAKSQRWSPGLKYTLDDAQRLRLAEDFADRLEQYNPRFDRDRFIAAAVENPQ